MKKNIYTLTKYEYETIKKRLGREPNDFETLILASMSSEHCSYKHSKRYLKKLKNKNAIMQDENAGAVKFGENYIFFKLESHNHPSAVSPYEGAATGIGGIVRDILTLNCKCLLLGNSIKFGNLNNKKNENLFNEVVRGISTYGNSIGIPTVCGETQYLDCYNNYAIVNVLALGKVNPNDVILSNAKPGLKVVILGSTTGSDGINGATFASKNLNNDINDEKKNDRLSVQISDPFMKRKLIMGLKEIFDKKLVYASQDCGAAGILSSTSELVSKGNCGVNLYLDKVHLRQDELSPQEIILSESQERMVILVEDYNINQVLSIAKKHEIGVSIFGETIKDKKYNVYFNNELLASLPPNILTNAFEYRLKVKKPKYIKILEKIKFEHNNNNLDLEYDICKILSHPNFKNKSHIFEQFDSTVGNKTIIGPSMCGGVSSIYIDKDNILGVSIDSNPQKVYLSPKNGVEVSFMDSYRKLVARGFKPVGVTNCLNFANIENEDISYQFVKSVEGLANISKKMNVPVVSGNVSMYNETNNKSIFPTVVLVMVGHLDNYKSIINNSFSEKETIFLLGKPIDEKMNIGGSFYQYVLQDKVVGKIDNINYKEEVLYRDIIFDLSKKNIINAISPIHTGGLFAALFKGLLKNELGFKGTLIFNFPQNDCYKELFGEASNPRYLISTTKQNELKEIFDKNSIDYKILGVTNVKETISFNEMTFDKNSFYKAFKDT